MLPAPRVALALIEWPAVVAGLVRTPAVASRRGCPLKQCSSIAQKRNWCWEAGNEFKNWPRHGPFRLVPLLAYAFSPHEGHQQIWVELSRTVLSLIVKHRFKRRPKVVRRQPQLQVLVNAPAANDQAAVTLQVRRGVLQEGARLVGIACNDVHTNASDLRCHVARPPSQSFSSVSGELRVRREVKR
eukprot:scaffold13048_cov68-Phaeocystis_antarctica.AAC.3